MEIVGMALFVLLGGAALIALLITVNLLVPVSVEAARRKLESNLFRSFLVGLVNLVFAVALLALLTFFTTQFEKTVGNSTIIDLGQFLAPGIFVVLGVLIALTVLVFSLRGLSALANLLGTRIGPAKTSFWSDARGGLLLVLACLTPYIGWFVFTPFVISLALGASILVLVQRKPKVSVSEKSA